MRKCLLTVSLLFVGASLGTSSTGAQTGPSLTAGFHAGVYGHGLQNPTAMSVGPDGRLYVAQENGAIKVLASGSPRTIATGFAIPLGLAWHEHRLYVSYTGKVSTLTPARDYRSFTRRTIVSGLPTGKHQNDGMAFRGGWMYLGVGSTCDACVETDPRSATIMRFRDNGTSAQVYARGLRNPYGLAIRPRTGDLYATDNGRDDFGNSVPDELNRIVRGGNYGWPDCWGNGGGRNCNGTIGAAALLEPHSSADGLVIFASHTFPTRYRGDAFIAEFGRTVGTGYEGHRVKDVHFSGGQLTVTDFATGFNRPLAVTGGRDGALLVADFATGLVWRIQANGH